MCCPYELNSLSNCEKSPLEEVFPQVRSLLYESPPLPSLGDNALPCAPFAGIAAFALAPLHQRYG
jgi:hypothetical protein